MDVDISESCSRAGAKNVIYSTRRKQKEKRKSEHIN